MHDCSSEYWPPTTKMVNAFAVIICVRDTSAGSRWVDLDLAVVAPRRPWPHAREPDGVRAHGSDLMAARCRSGVHPARVAVTAPRSGSRSESILLSVIVCKQIHMISKQCRFQSDLIGFNHDGCQADRRPRSAAASVPSSSTSSAPPIGTPCPTRLTATPVGRN